MKRRLSLYVRQHVNGWYTAALLDRPSYAAFGPDLSSLRDELVEAVEDDLVAHHFSMPRPTDAPMQHRTITVELKAVQFQRLVTVPLRVSLFESLADPKRRLYDVRIPRIEQSFTIVGHEHVLAWAEEIIRGHFHLSDVQAVMRYQYERAEKLDVIEVRESPVRHRRRGPNLSVEVDVEDVREAAHPLLGLGIDLVAEAADRRIERARYRTEEVRTVEGVLSSPHQPSVLLVGEAGVGKTAIVHEVAHRISEGHAGQLNGARLWAIGGARIIAGAKFLGEWQARAKMVVELIKSVGDVWFVGDLLELLTSGNAKEGHGVAQFLLPELQAGALSLIVETTPDGLAMAEQLDATFVRALQHVPVRALDLHLTEDILERRAVVLGRTHRVKWSAGAVTSALDVVARFGDANGLPGSGLVLLDRMARVERRTTGATEVAIGATDAIAAFARMSGFPEPLIDPDQRLDVDAVRAFFETRVIGQRDATDRLTSLIMLLKAGLDDPERPLGSFLFTGPTGVGKTESALTLTEYLFSDRKRVTRFDMSEYAYPGSGLRLVDGARGEGELTRPVRREPFSLLLFDEIEKADPSVLDVLLQVLGEGRLTDGTGRTVRFTHTIVIMTSNLGAARRAPVGYADSHAQDPAAHYQKAVEQFFRPELLNRIDHVVPFSDLGRGSLTQIAEKMLADALAREGFSRRRVVVDYSRAVIERLSDVGFDPKYGARPMKRAVDSLIIVPLARMLAQRGDVALAGIELDVVDQKLAIRIR